MTLTEIFGPLNYFESLVLHSTMMNEKFSIQMFRKLRGIDIFLLEAITFSGRSC